MGKLHLIDYRAVETRVVDDLVALWLHMYSSEVLAAFPNPQPMTRSYRFIGGYNNGRSHNIGIGLQAVYIGLQTYERRTLSFNTSTATFREEVFVLKGLTDRQALEVLVKLPMPALPVVPNFKAFSIDDSSAIDEIRYDRALRILEVDLVGSGTYRYENVPANVAGELLLAESKGQFFNSFIKGQYPSTKIS